MSKGVITVTFQINLLLAKIDTDGNGIVDNDELITFMRRHISSDDPAGDLFHVFRMLDKGQGLVSGRDVRTMVKRHARLPDPLVREILASFQDNDEYDFDQFLAVICQENPTTK